MMMNENHNGYRSVVAASELKNLSFGLRLVLTSFHLWGVGRKRGENRRSSQDYKDYKEKPDHSYMVSDKASNYFVTGEDGIKPGSIPSDTLRWTISSVDG
jgi:hypothetical protein